MNRQLILLVICLLYINLLYAESAVKNDLNKNITRKYVQRRKVASKDIQTRKVNEAYTGNGLQDESIDASRKQVGQHKNTRNNIKKKDINDHPEIYSVRRSNITRNIHDDVANYLTRADEDYYGKFTDDLVRLKVEIARRLLRTSNGAILATFFSNRKYREYEYTYASTQMLGEIVDPKYNGIPYFYMRKDDTANADLRQDNYCSVLVTDATNGDCQYWSLGSKDNKCHKMVYIGEFADVTNSAETNLALQQMKNRYLGLKNVNATEYTMSKLNVRAIFFGESAEPLVLKDYYNARPYGWDKTVEQGSGPAIFPEDQIDN